MTVLIFLNILLIIFFTLLGLSGNVGQNWFNRRDLATQAIQDPTTKGPTAEQIVKNVQPLLERNGVDGVDLNSQKRGDIIYL